MAKNNSANVGFEEKLWAAADKMRGSMDPAEYKHVVLGLIFLKYISDSFEKRRQDVIKEDGEEFVDDHDEYTMKNVFWVPMIARWSNIRDNAKKSEIGKLIDDAMYAIEKENSDLKGVLPKDYARPALDKQRLGGVIDIISQVDLLESNGKDVLGRIYEYFLGRFAGSEGKGGGEFYTPQCIVKLLVEMIEPYSGRVYDPCCGSGGMFIQSEMFNRNHDGKKDDMIVYGQESNHTTWRLCKMNLALRHIDSSNIKNGNSFHNDSHPDLKADFVLANPPFNDSDWDGQLLRNDVRWKYGLPPTGSANYAWIQHFIYHLAPTGIAGFVMANGAMSSNSSGEGEIRANLIKAGLVDCIVAMPDKLFYSTGIPCSLWFVSRDRYDHKFRNRHDEILFIDARKMGTMVDRRHRELTDEDVRTISETYHNWRNLSPSVIPSEAEGSFKYEDKKGFCKAAKIEEVEKNGYVLTPGRYVGTELVEEDDEVFEEKMQRLTAELNQQFVQSKELEEKIKENLKKVIEN
ncbi:MAG: class I SAM-dependent DNA methyltransferase [Patescibacteria group bacterium]